jgi:hypothetical protein
MTQAEHNRKKAAEAEEKARHTTDSYTQKSYEEIACGYRALADQIERHNW